MIKQMVKKILNEDLDLKDNIIYFLWYNNFSCFLRRIGRFLKRLFTWLPVVWKQENWDIDYLYDLIEFKMKEILQAVREDDIHADTEETIRQIEECLKELDMWRNWTDYYDYPMEDIKHVPCEDGCYKMIHTSEENEKQRLGAIDFEKEHYDKFWKLFLEYHHGWWV